MNQFMNFPLTFIKTFHIPTFEIQSAKTEAEKRISDLESQSAMFKKEMHLGIDHHVSIYSAAGIGSVSLWRRR